MHNSNKARVSIALDIYSQTPLSTSVKCHIVDQKTCNLPQSMIYQSTLQIILNQQMKSFTILLKKQGDCSRCVFSGATNRKYWSIPRKSTLNCRTTTRHSQFRRRRSHKWSISSCDISLPLAYHYKMRYLAKVILFLNISKYWETGKVPKLLLRHFNVIQLEQISKV